MQKKPPTNVLKKNQNLEKPNLKKKKTLDHIFFYQSDVLKIVEKRKTSYFGLAHNLIRHLISPNQDYLSYSPRTFHFRSTNRVSCQTQSFLAGERRPVQTSHWPFFNSDALAVQRRPVQTSHCGFKIAAAAATWTNEGTHLIYGFLIRNPSWI